MHSVRVAHQTQQSLSARSRAVAIRVFGSLMSKGITAELSQNLNARPGVLRGGLGESFPRGRPRERVSGAPEAACRFRRGNESRNRPSALRHEDFLAVLDAEQVRRERGLELRYGSLFHETIIVVSRRPIGLVDMLWAGAILGASRSPKTQRRTADVSR